MWWLAPQLSIVIVLCGTAATHYSASATSNYSIDEAINFAVLSQIAYCDDAAVSSWNCPYCSRQPSFSPITILRNDSTDVHGYIGVDVKACRIVVSFRGTEDLRNWIINLNGFEKADFPLPFCASASGEAAIHDGFFEAYQSLQQQVHTGLSGVLEQHPNFPVIVTGHSLGAALATMCSLDLVCTSDFNISHRVKLDNVTLYNYGAPRMGNEAFADAVKATTRISLWRNVHWRDIVPHLPPHDILGYEHAPTEVFLPEVWNTSYYICDGSGEDPNCSDQFDIGSVEDHLSYFNLTMYSGGC